MSSSSAHDHPQRRLSARRGSASAPDPFARHVEAETPRAITSRLTIVRVPSGGSDSYGPESAVSSGGSRPNSSDGSSLGRRSSWGSRSAGSASSGGKKLSFAFSTFTPINPPQNPASSPRTEQEGPPSPALGFGAKGRTHSGGNLASLVNRQATLTPQQLLELAQNPTQVTPGDAPFAHHVPDVGVAPAAFRPLPDDEYLPYIDRPAEVSSLLSSGPTARLFALLCQSFLPSKQSEEQHELLPEDPLEWSTQDLNFWLTQVPRSEADDREWVRKARTCVTAHSELIWERLKNALGVPPELEEDDSDGEEGELEPEYDSETFEVEDEEQEPQPETWVEPIYSSSLKTPEPDMVASPISFPPPTSDGYAGSDRVMDAIGETEEEPVEDLSQSVSSAEGLRVGSIHETVAQAENEEPIQGFRIYTSTIPIDPVVPRTSPLASAVVDWNPPIEAPGVSGLRRSHSHGASSARSSFDFGPGRRPPPPSRRSMSHGVVGRPTIDIPRRSSAFPGAGFDSGEHRGSIFASSFANLSVGPTMIANNPALRRPSVPSSPLTPASPLHQRLTTRSVRFEREPSKLAQSDPSEPEPA